jgi:hypothetical protein
MLVVEVRRRSVGDRVLSWNSKTQAEVMSQPSQSRAVELSSCGVKRKVEQRELPAWTLAL